jgi:hypothetical protein
VVIRRRLATATEARRNRLVVGVVTICGFFDQAVDVLQHVQQRLQRQHLLALERRFARGDLGADLGVGGRWYEQQLQVQHQSHSLHQDSADVADNRAGGFGVNLELLGHP